MVSKVTSNAELTRQLQALTTIVTNLADNIAGNQLPLTAAAPPTIISATSPGMTALEELINYMTKYGANLYEQKSQALGTPFSMKASHVVIFEKELQDRAIMMGWDKGVQNILKFTNRDGRQISLIAKYSRIDAETFKTGCKPFIRTTGINADKRAAQNKEQMWCCLYNSLTEEAKAALSPIKKTTRCL